MKKSAIAAIVIIVILIAGGVYWYVRHNNSSQPAPYSGTTDQSQTPPAGDQVTPPADSSLNTDTDGGDQTPTAPAAATVLKASSDATLGPILTASNGLTLYTYAADKPGVSNCTGDCAVKWPPYTVSATAAANLTADTGIMGKLATLTRADGTTQLTYNGQPLYFWYQDAKPGDTNGQNVGGVWFVVKP